VAGFKGLDMSILVRLESWCKRDPDFKSSYRRVTLGQALAAAYWEESEKQVRKTPEELWLIKSRSPHGTKIRECDQFGKWRVT
jgi:hypothetical protein